MSEVHTEPVAPVAAPVVTGEAPVTEHEVAGILGRMLERDDEREARVPRDREPPQQDTESTEAAPGDDQAAEEDVAADESPPSDDEPAESDEPAQRPAIDPPGGWTREDREVWSQLPAKAQEIVRRRETEILGAQTRAQQERAEIERLALARIDQDRTQYQQNLAVFKGVLAPRAAQYDQVDWRRLANENPADYVRLQAERGAMQQQLALIDGEVTRIQQQVQYETQVRQEQAKREGYRQLVAEIPEFGDPNYAQRVGTELGQFLRGYGFSDQEIAGCTDHRPIKLALALMNAEKAKAAVASANTKRTPPPAPSVQRAGNSSHSNGADSSSRRMTQLVAKFEKSPTVQDAAAIYREWMRQSS